MKLLREIKKQMLLRIAKSAARLEWKSFFALTQNSILTEIVSKKDWERKADKAAQISQTISC